MADGSRSLCTHPRGEYCASCRLPLALVECPHGILLSQPCTWCRRCVHGVAGEGACSMCRRALTHAAWRVLIGEVAYLRDEPTPEPTVFDDVDPTEPDLRDVSEVLEALNATPRACVCCGRDARRGRATCSPECDEDYAEVTR